MSKEEALRRQGERTAPIQPQSPASDEKRDALGELADERSDTVLQQLQQESSERMTHGGGNDLRSGLPGTAATSGNDANIGHPDVEGSEPHHRP